MSEEELAFYDALEVNDDDNMWQATSRGKSVRVTILRQIAHELTDTVRRNASIDWMLKRASAPSYVLA